MSTPTPGQEARRRKLELRLLLGVDALLTTQELCDIFAVRESELLAWLKRLPIHIVAGKQHYRYGDVVKLSRTQEERTSQSDDPPRGTGRLRRTTLAPVKKNTG